MAIISFIFVFTSTASENLTLHVEVRTLLQEIKCITCTGQTVLGSESDFAKMITKYVISEFASGKSPAQIKQNLIAIYGDEILITPQVKPQNYIVWFMPMLIFAAVFWALNKRT